MKKLILTSIALFFVISSSFAQAKYFTRTGHISFFSEAPIENIEAHNNQSTCILNGENGELAFSVIMRGFEFEKALMQEHFNENYVESNKYPKSTFKGKITNFENVDLSKEGRYEVNVKGQLTIHGESKEVSSDGVIEIKSGRINAITSFPITLSDYNISIPKAVIDNIAKVIEIKVDLNLEPYNN